MIEEYPSITVECVVQAPIEKVWEFWNKPEYIVRWAFASADWEAPEARNDLRVGGTFTIVMAAKDGSTRFDFGGTYTAVEENKLIEYAIEDGRTVRVEFEVILGGVQITETFTPEKVNPEAMQRAGWQAILDNFKKVVETVP